MSSPTVSVIVPTWNRQALLAHAVASVRVQTFEDWELIVVDDQSTDASDSMLARLQEPRLRCVRMPEKGGPARARNTALAIARGRYVAFLDSDDLWAPEKLASQMAILDGSTSRWSYTGIRRIDLDGQDLPVHLTADRLPQGRVLEQVLSTDAVIAMSTVMVERSLIEEAGGFDPAFEPVEDYEFYVRLAMHGTAVTTTRPLSAVRVHEASFQSDRVRAHRSWVRLYEHYSRVLRSRRLGALCRRRRNDHLLLLAGKLVNRRRAFGALGALLRAAPDLWRRRAFWRTAGSAALVRFPRARAAVKRALGTNQADLFAAPVLGIPVAIRSGSRGVAGIAESSFGQWRGLATYPDLLEPQGVTLTVELDAALGGAAKDAAVTYRKPAPHRLELAGPSCAGWADRARGEAHLLVAPDLLAATEQFRYLVLEAAVLYLLTGPERFPVHASAVARDGAALLLAGSSGVGKSTLAWLAGEAGWSVLSDDVVYVQQHPRWRVWAGGSARSYFAAGAERFVPALAGQVPRLRDNEKLKYALGRTLPMPPLAERAALCLLERGAAPRVAPVAEAAALAALLAAPEPGFDVFGAGAAERLRPLAARAVRLTVGADPAAAVPLLEGIHARFFG